MFLAGTRLLRLLHVMQKCEVHSSTRPVSMFKEVHRQVGRFHTFYRPQRPLARVEVQLYSIFRPRHQKGVSGQRYVPAAFYPRRRPGTHCTGGWVGPRACLDGRKSRPIGIRSPDRPAHSQSLYRLSYLVHFPPYSPHKISGLGGQGERGTRHLADMGDARNGGQEKCIRCFGQETLGRPSNRCEDNITIVKGKVVRVQVVQACMWNGGTAPLILNLGARWR